MPEDIIKTIKEAEEESARKLALAKSAAEDEIRAATAESEKKVSDAEVDAESAIRAAKAKGESRAAEIKKKHEDGAREEAEAMVASAEEKKDEAVEFVVRELIGKWL